MKKALLKVLILCMAVCSALCVFTACMEKQNESTSSDGGNTSQLNSFKIAGLYEYKGTQLFVLDNLTFMLTYSSYEFFGEGIVNAKYVGATLSGKYVERSGIATYKTVKIDNDYYRVDLYVLETGKTTTIFYYGMSISDGDITLNLSGPNMFNELEGTVAMVQYGKQVEYFDGVRDIPFGEINGEKTQFVNKGGITSSVETIAEKGFEFVGWSDGVSSNSRYETDVKENKRINAIFRQVQNVYKMEYSANEGGQLEGENLQYVVEGETASSVTAVPGSAYLFSGWSDGLTSATRNDVANNNLSVTANFDYKYTIDYFGIPNDEKRYGIKGATVEPVTAGEIDGYKFLGWSDGVKTATRQDVIDDNLINNNSYDRYSRTITVYAEYEKVKTLSYVVWPTNSGHIEGNAAQLLSEGDVGTQVTAIANQGYRFSHWERSSTPVGENPTRTDTMVNIDLTYYAIFERVCYINYYAEEGGYINGVTEQIVLYGEGHPENVQAVANDGYEFVGWSDGATSPYRYDDRPTADISVTAQFKKITGDDTEDPIMPTEPEKPDTPEEPTKTYNFKYKFNSELEGYVISGYEDTETDIVIPSKYKNVPIVGIGDRAFDGCSSLTSVTIGNSVTSIGDNAFYNCSSLTSVTIGNSVKSIWWHAFENCSGLTSITIPNSVTSIAGCAFYGCSSLRSITIPNSVTSIDIDAFYGCSSLTSVNIGNSVTSIGDYAFYGCSSLTSVNYTGTIDEWVSKISALRNLMIYSSSNKKLYINGELVTEANISTAAIVNAYAFYNCSGLTSVTIGNSVTSIGIHAFDGCGSLKSAYIDSASLVNYASFIDTLPEYETDIYILTDLEPTLSIYTILYEKQDGTVTHDGKEYYHYKIKE